MHPIYLCKIADFIQEHLKYPNLELLKSYIEEHEKFGTLDYAIDTNNDIVAVCRWNLSSDGKLATVLDFVIRATSRHQGIGSDFILRALKRFPKLENIEFQRGIRGQTKYRTVNIQGILKRHLF